MKGRGQMNEPRRRKHYSDRAIAREGSAQRAAEVHLAEGFPRFAVAVTANTPFDRYAPCIQQRPSVKSRFSLSITVTIARPYTPTAPHPRHSPLQPTPVLTHSLSLVPLRSPSLAQCRSGRSAGSRLTPFAVRFSRFSLRRRRFAPLAVHYVHRSPYRDPHCARITPAGRGTYGPSPFEPRRMRNGLRQCALSRFCTAILLREYAMPVSNA
jgi:hypothetical protein